VKFQYEIATGNLIQAGMLPDLSGDDVLDLDIQIPADINWWKVDNGTLRQKTQEEYDAWNNTQDRVRGRFDLVLFQTDLSNLLPSLSNPNLRWEFAALNTYATNKDFEGMAGYMDMLVGAGAALQTDDDAVIALLTKQGIVL
jgi:hypothetical protein